MGKHSQYPKKFKRITKEFNEQFREIREKFYEMSWKNSDCALKIFEEIFVNSYKPSRYLKNCYRIFQENGSQVTTGSLIIHKSLKKIIENFKTIKKEFLQNRKQHSK